MKPATTACPDFGLKNQNAVVFGAAPGMGLTCIDALASVGCNVACADIDVAVASAAADQARKRGVKAVAVKVDTLDPESVRGALDQVARDLGGIDVMVNIIGGGVVMAPLEDVTIESWDRVVGLNLRQMFITMQAAPPHLRRAGGGSIVALSSINSLKSSPGLGPYGASKAALNSLVATLAIEAAPAGIRVNAVAPGVTSTPRVAPLYEGELGAVARSTIPSGRLGSTVDIGNAVVFLASNLAAYITGQTLVVDGGLMAMHPLPLP